MKNETPIATRPAPRDTTIRVTIEASGITTTGEFTANQYVPPEEFADECASIIKGRFFRLHHDLKRQWVQEKFEELVRRAARRKAVDVEGEFLKRYGAPPFGRTAMDFWLEQDRQFGYHLGVFPEVRGALFRGEPLPGGFAVFDDRSVK